MKQHRRLLTAFGILSLGTFTGCHENTILVSKHFTGPVYSKGDTLTWEKRKMSPPFVVFITAKTCKEELRPPASLPNRIPTGYNPLPQGDSTSCTFTSDMKGRNDFQYYIEFLPEVKAPDAGLPGEPAEGPFNARTGSCNGC